MRVTKCDVCGKISEITYNPTKVNVIDTYYAKENNALNAVKTVSLDLCYDCEQKAKTHLLLAYPREFQSNSYSFFNKDIKTLMGYNK